MSESGERGPDTDKTEERRQKAKGKFVFVIWLTDIKSNNGKGFGLVWEIN